MLFSFFRSSMNLPRVFLNSRSILPASVHKTLFSAKLINTEANVRSLYNMSRKPSTLYPSKSSVTYACSCTCGMHTKGDQELVAFLGDEIANEQKSKLPFDLNKFSDFQCKFDGAEVTLTKKFNQETITIIANVSNSVDAEDTVVDPNDTKEPQESAMESRPEFTVEVTKGQKTLCFHCTYNSSLSDEEPEAEPYNDAFQISEISMYEGECKDSTYAVSGDIMDGYLYDLLMNYLEERGISNDFADKLVTLFTHHEHSLYLTLLESMKRFVEK